MMNAIFTPEIAERWPIVYMDDILITTQDDPKFYEECIHCILEKLCLHDLLYISNWRNVSLNNSKWNS